MRFAHSLLLVAVVTFGAASPGAAQEGPPLPPERIEAEAGPPPVEGGALSPLPPRPAPPRTLRDHWHVFAAFALAWVLLFGYTVSIGRRFARVEGELRELGGGRAT